MGALGVILTILFLIILSVGGYFGYQKLYKPWACNTKGQDLSSNVSTFVWSSNVCTANTCTSGHGDASGKPLADGSCPLFVKQYTPGTGKGPECVGGVGTDSTTATDAASCKSECDGQSSCVAYDWTTNTKPPKCTIYTGSVSVTTSDSSCMISK